MWRPSAPFGVSLIAVTPFRVALELDLDEVHHAPDAVEMIDGALGLVALFLPLDVTAQRDLALPDLDRDRLGNCRVPLPLTCDLLRDRRVAPLDGARQHDLHVVRDRADAVNPLGRFERRALFRVRGDIPAEDDGAVLGGHADP